MGKKALETFTPAMVRACEAALDAEIFYQDEFKDFVVQRMGGYDCEPVLLQLLNVDLDAADGREKKRALAELVAKSPRGCYGVIHTQCDDGRQWYSLAVSDGTGETAVGGRYDSYDKMPTGADVLDRMIGFEIYLCRQAVEDERLRQKNVAALAEHGFSIGTELRNIKPSGERTPFSRATVRAVDAETGTVTLFLVRRGSPKRWEMAMGASRLAELAGLRQPEPNKRPFIILVQSGGAVDDNTTQAAG